MTGIGVDIRGFTKDYGNMTVVDGVSLSVAAGSFVTLLGPSGSGKSTLLMGVAGFTRPTRGNIFFGDRDVTVLPPRQRNIGMVFQNYALFPHMTVAQNIAFPLIQRGVPKADIAPEISKMMQLVGLRGMDDRPVTRLSGGQQQRVALARALVFRPPILLMDEPLGALDKKMREHLQSEIKEIQQVTGTTALFVTHDQDEAMSMSDQIVVLNHGRIEQQGTSAEIYDTPASAFVADFVGEANLLQGTIAQLGSQGCLVEIGHNLLVCGTPASGAVLEIGDTVDVIVRPNKIGLGRECEPMPGFLPGEMVSSAYLGEAILIRVRLPSNRIITAKLKPEAGRPDCQRVSVTWDYNSSIVFPRRNGVNSRGNQNDPTNSQ